MCWTVKHHQPSDRQGQALQPDHLLRLTNLMEICGPRGAQAFNKHPFHTLIALIQDKTTTFHPPGA